MVAALPESQRVPPKGISPDEERQMLERGLERFRRLKEKGRSEGKARSERKAWPEEKTLRQLPVVRSISPNAASISPSPASLDSPPPTITPIRRKGLPYRWIAAASVLVVATGAFLYFDLSRKTAATPAAPTVVAAKRGVRSFMELPDGSKLWLNAGSKVVFSDDFRMQAEES